eukprot:Hpha_TRINITY_DN15105_c7_g8::TRINITY_DN15105_c7_g8_i1::g.126916::m.126916/K11265/ADCY10; adenylate cyclase 10
MPSASGPADAATVEGGGTQQKINISSPTCPQKPAPVSPDADGLFSDGSHGSDTEELSQADILGESIGGPRQRQVGRSRNQATRKTSGHNSQQRRPLPRNPSGGVNAGSPQPHRGRKKSLNLEGVSLKMLQACIPVQLYDWLGKVEYDPAAAFEETDAGMLFVDISGFSAVAHLLNEIGSSEGAEVLTHHLNQYFARLLKAIKDGGGDVVLFSGDAMMVSWCPHYHQNSLSCAVRRMIKTADMILREVGEYTFQIQAPDGPRTCRMNIHMGAGEGRVCRMVVGGSGSPAHGVWRYIVSGAPVEEAGIAANVATNGQLVCAPGLLEKYFSGSAPLRVKSKEVESKLRGQTANFSLFEALAENRSGASPVLSPRSMSYEAPPEPVVGEGLSQLMKPALSSFAFDTLLDAVSSGRSGELRTVSTVFIHLSGIDPSELSPKDLHSRLNTAFQIIQKNVTRADGVVNKLVMDDKGVICLCLFGIPRHVHEDDPERAVYFALKVKKKLGKEIGGVVIGISRAKVFCGLTGDDWRLEYTVLGDGVNTAARLMQSALGFRKQHVMCDMDTARDCKTGDGLQFAPAPDLKMKGRDTPVTCFHVVREGEEFMQLPGGRSQQQMSLSHSPSGFSPRPFMPASPGRGLNASGSANSFVSLSSVASNRSFASNGSRTSVRMLRVGTRGSPGVSGSPPRRSGSPGRMSISSGSTASYSPGSPGRFSRMTSGGSQVVTEVEATSNRDQAGGQLRGRDEELSMLRTLVDAVRAVHRGGRPVQAWSVSPGGPGRSSLTVSPRPGSAMRRVLHFVGKTQTGKTALLMRAGEMGHAAGLGVLAITGDPTLTDVSYASIRGAIRNVLAQHDIHSLETLCDPEDAPNLPLLQFIERVPELGMPDEKFHIISGENKVRQINELLLAVFKSSIGWPLLCLVDDCQYVDNLTWSFLHHIHNSGAATVLASKDFLTGRPDGTTGPTWKLGDRRVSRETADSSSSEGEGGSLGLDLKGFPTKIGSDRYRTQVLSGEECRRRQIHEVPREALRELLLQECACEDADEAAVELLEAKSGGVPGTAIQMLQGLVEAGGLTILPDGFVMLTPGMSFDEMVVNAVPTVETQVMRAVDTLSEPLRKVLTVACVLASPLPGAAFDEKLAEEVCAADANTGSKDKAPDPPFEALMSTLQGDEWVEQDAKAEGRLTFARPIAADVVYRASLAAHRRKLHSLAAKILARRGGADGVVLAAHHKRAGEHEELLAVATDAYRLRVVKGELGSALELLADAAAAAHRLGLPSRGQEAELDLAECLYETGQLGPALQTCLVVTRVQRRRPKRCGFLCCFRPQVVEEPSDEFPWVLRVQARVLLSEVQLWEADDTALLASIQVLVEESATTGARSADYTALAGGKLSTFAGHWLQTAKFLCGKVDSPQPHSAIPTNAFDTLTLFSGWDAHQKLSEARSAELRKELSLSPVPETAQVEDIGRPSVKHLILALSSLTSLLTGEGAQALGFASELHASAVQFGDGRWRAYASLLRALVAGHYTEGVAGMGKNAKWERTGWRVSDAFRMAEGVRNLKEFFPSDSAFAALSGATRVFLLAGYGAAPGFDLQCMINTLEIAFEDACRPSNVLTPFHATAVVLSLDAAIRLSSSSGFSSFSLSAPAPEVQRLAGKYTEILTEAARVAAQRYPLLSPAAELCEGMLAKRDVDMPKARGHWHLSVKYSTKLGVPQTLHSIRAQAQLAASSSDSAGQDAAHGLMLSGRIMAPEVVSMTMVTSPDGTGLTPIDQPLGMIGSGSTGRQNLLSLPN